MEKPDEPAPRRRAVARELARAPGVAADPMVVTKSLSRASGSSAPGTVMRLALNDASPSRGRPRFSDPDLPAVSGGGLDYVYRAPTPGTVPSTGALIRVPLATQVHRAAVFHQATPALAATAFLRARVRNDGTRPLLGGPASIFVGGELVGQGRVATTGPGGDVELPLGADEDIRLVRTVVPSTKISGLILKSEETTYEVRIQVGNYKKRPATVELTDQVPRGARDKVEVKLLGADPATQAAPDANGIVRWRVEVPAGGTRTVSLRYVIVRPKGWRLYQR
jgi:uncharacterized protein (TIGR02231 family)